MVEGDSKYIIKKKIIIMDHMDKYDELKKIITEDIEIEGRTYNLEKEFEKFFVKGNKSAGTRIRKFMQILRRYSEGIRNDVQEYKKSI